MLDKLTATLENLIDLPIRKEINLQKITPPKNLASRSYALAAEIDTPNATQIVTYGRLIFLQNDKPNEDWGGVNRIVALLSADIEPNMATDPLLPQVAWSWIVESLRQNNSNYSALRGTTTITNSESFLDDSSLDKSNQIEIRCSWSPRQEDYPTHILAFCTMLENLSGLPPENVPILKKY